ncbi:MAG: hypothetical protein GC159_07265 [Phycisphaera sp.]|nr:hypothetical protein [Phycisphaera sp.]
MIIYRGLGIIVPVFALGWMGIVVMISRQIFEKGHEPAGGMAAAWFLGIALFAGLFGHYLHKHKPNEAHDLFFIPVRFWAIPAGALCLLMAVGGMLDPDVGRHGAASSGTWTRHDFAELGYSVELPRPPRSERGDTEMETIATATNTLNCEIKRDEQCAFTLLTVETPAGVDEDAFFAKNMETYLLDLYDDADKGTKVKPLSVAGSDRALEARGSLRREGTKLTLWSRAIQRDRRMYRMLAVFGTKEGEQEARRIIDSFRLLDTPRAVEERYASPEGGFHLDVPAHQVSELKRDEVQTDTGTETWMKVGVHSYASTFVQWSRLPSGVDAAAYLTTTGEAELKAKFDAQKITPTIERSVAPGIGEVVDGRGQGDYDGTPITVWIRQFVAHGNVYRITSVWDVPDGADQSKALVSSFRLDEPVEAVAVASAVRPPAPREPSSTKPTTLAPTPAPVTPRVATPAVQPAPSPAAVPVPTPPVSPTPTPTRAPAPEADPTPPVPAAVGRTVPGTPAPAGRVAPGTVAAPAAVDAPAEPAAPPTPTQRRELFGARSDLSRLMTTIRRGRRTGDPFPVSLETVPNLDAKERTDPWGDAWDYHGRGKTVPRLTAEPDLLIASAQSHYGQRIVAYTNGRVDAIDEAEFAQLNSAAPAAHAVPPAVATAPGAAPDAPPADTSPPAAPAAPRTAAFDNSLSPTERSELTRAEFDARSALSGLRIAAVRNDKRFPKTLAESQIGGRPLVDHWGDAWIYNGAGKVYDAFDKTDTLLLATAKSHHGRRVVAYTNGKVETLSDAEFAKVRR